MRLSKLMTLAAACFLLVPGLAATAGAEPTMFKEAPAGAPDPDKLAQDVNDRLTDGMVDSRIDVEITLVNANGGKRVRKLDRYQKNFNVTDRKFILVFNSPADVKKTAFLVWDYEDADKDDDRWLYLPSMKQTRRISGASKNDYFMGSDLTYDDLGKRPVKKDAHKIIGEENFMGHPCWLLEAVPHKVEDNDYVRLVTWVDKESQVMRKRNYYDKDGLLKVQTAYDIRKLDGVWSYIHVEVENQVNKHKTVLIESNHRYNTGIKDDLFRESVLQRGVM
ncbi:MAG: outer membrane lipoprotein-sorting protein [Desulfovibrio sp.]|jgi:outer membrane lipoprotein-sorting protein|nr:outer membrane lipoprotein-sorting protein [Desulfovibrio sp.]